jgi:hypothetical protein
MLSVRRRLVMWAVVAVGLPLVARGLHQAAVTIETRLGPTPATRRLHQAGRVAEGVQSRLIPRQRRRRR